MFLTKFAWDLVVGILVVLALAKTWDTDKKSGFKLSLTTAVLVIGAVLIAAHHGFKPPRSQGVGLSKVNWPEWWQIVIALMVIGYNTVSALRSFKKQAWLGDKPDRLAGVTSILVGLFWATAIFSIGHLISSIFVILAIMAHVSLCNVQVPEQELWTPKWFGKRCYNSTFMLGEYCFGSGFKWMLIPRNIPGLTFNVVILRKNLQVKFQTTELPTRGAVIKGLNGEDIHFGGDVKVDGTFILDGPDDLDAYWSAPPTVRTDAGLADYARELLEPYLRPVLKDRTLDEVLIGGIFTTPEWKGNESEVMGLLAGASGYKVKKCLINDPNPSAALQKQLDELAAQRIKVVQAELDRQIDVLRAKGVGEAKVAELMPLAEALEKNNVRDAVAAVRALDMARFSNLRVLVDRHLGGIAPFVAEGVEDQA